MREATKYFDVLQVVVNVISYEDIEDRENVENGLAGCFDGMYDLNYDNLVSEPTDLQKFEALVRVNRSTCNRNSRISFLDVTEVLMKGWIDNMKTIHPNIGEGVGMVDANVVTEFFIDRREELLSLFPQYIATLNSPEDSTEGLRLPIELDTPDFKRLYSWSKEGGLFVDDYDWKNGEIKTKRRLAYWCYKMSKALELGKNQREKGSKTEKDNRWKPFEELFELKNLRQNLKDLKKKDEELRGVYPDIDKYFD